MAGKKSKSHRRLFEAGSSSQQQRTNQDNPRSTSENEELHPDTETPELNLPPYNNITQTQSMHNLNPGCSSHGSPSSEEEEGPDHNDAIPQDPRPLVLPDMRNIKKPGFIPNRPAVDFITSLWRSYLKPEWLSWKFVPMDMKLHLFNEWKRQVRYDPRYERDMYKAFMYRAGRSMGGSFEAVREKKKQPVWMGEQMYAAFKAHWASPEFDTASQRAKQNSESGEGPSSHTSGSIGHGTIEMKLAKELQRKPTELEMFVHTHKKAAGGAWVDERAKATHTAYDEAADTKAKELGIQKDELDPDVQRELWKKVAKPNKKGQFYGLSSYHDEGSSSTSSTLSQPWTDPYVKKLEAKVASMDTKMDDMTQKIASMHEEHKEMMETMMNKMMAALMKGKKKKKSSSKKKKSSKRSRFHQEQQRAPEEAEESTQSESEHGSSSDDSE